MSKEYIGPGQFDDDHIVIYDIHEEIDIKQYRHNRIESMRKSKRKLLLHYMTEKSDFLEELTGIKLYENFDFTRAKRLQYKDVKTIVESISETASDWLGDISDGSVCPECRLHKGECNKCSFALKHKCCNGYGNSSSTYRKIIASIISPYATNEKIANAIGKQTLKLYFKWNN